MGGALNLNGWRQPRGGRWKIEMPPPLDSVPTPPPDLSQFERLLLAGLAAFAFGVFLHVTGWVPSWMALPMLGMADLSRLIDGIPMVRDSTDRDALFPSPPPNQRVHDLTLDVIQRFGASGWRTDFFSGGPVFPPLGGLTDVTINAAIAAAGAAGGGIVPIAGIATLAAPITLNVDGVWLQGNGRVPAVLRQTNPAVDVLQVTSQASKASDFTLDYATPANPGTYALHLTDSGRSKYDDLVLGANIYNGALIEATAGASAERVVRNFFWRVICASIPPGNGLTLTGGSSTRRVIDQHFDECHWAGAVNAFLLNDWVQGTFFRAAIDEFSGRGGLIDPTATLRTFDTFFDDCVFDGNTTNENLRARNTHGVNVNNCWLGTTPAGIYSVHLADGVTRSYVQNCTIAHKESGPAGLGCVFVDGDNVQVRNNTLIQGAIAPTNAAIVLGANSSLCDVHGNTLNGFSAAKGITDAGTNNSVGPNYGDAYGPEARFVSRIRTAGNIHGVSGTYLFFGEGAGDHAMRRGGAPVALEVLAGDASDYADFRARAYYVGANKVVGARGAAVADATDAASVILRLNELLARCRAHGLIAP